NHRTASDIAQELAADFLAGRVDAVYIVYNEFISAISQRVQLSQLLPFQAAGAPAAERGSSSHVDFLYEPSAQEVLNRLVPQALSIKVYRALLESVASEH